MEGKRGNYIALAVTLSALGALLLCSQAALESARAGLNLCAQMIVPSLLPFFILSSLLQQLGLPGILGRWLSPVTQKLFGIGGAGASALLLGVTGGYPLGADAVARLRRSGALTREQAERDGRAYLERVGLSDKVDKYPDQLSGGQQQRVAIARALNMHPKIMLLDEPTSALDPELVNEVLDVIKSLAETNMTIVMVTHEMGLAREAADKVVFMENGLVVDQGTPHYLFDETDNARVKSFLSKIL